MIYDNTDILLRCVILDLSNKIYFAEQLSFDIVSKCKLVGNMAVKQRKDLCKVNV